MKMGQLRHERAAWREVFDWPTALIGTGPPLRELFAQGTFLAPRTK